MKISLKLNENTNNISNPEDLFSKVKDILDSSLDKALISNNSKKNFQTLFNFAKACQEKGIEIEAFKLPNQTVFSGKGKIVDISESSFKHTSIKLSDGSYIDLNSVIKIVKNKSGGGYIFIETHYEW